MRFLFIFCWLLIPVIAQGQVFIDWYGSSSSGATVTVTDDFSGTDLNAYTQRAGTWVLDTGTEDLDTPTGQSDAGIIHNTATGTTKQWAKVDVKSPQWAADTGVEFRNPGVTGTSYLIYYDDSSDDVTWKFLDVASTTATTIQTVAVAGNYSDAPYVFAASIEGTGSSTIIQVWFNPSGATPDDWGVADYTLTDDPATAADTGQRVGLSINGNNNAVTFDNFSFGGW